MRLERLALNGLTRFTEPVTVDFSAFAPGALIAIVGENGSGKTTLLDSTLAALYRTFPSRAEKGLIKYATGKHAYIDEVFSVGPVRYHARVSMDATTGRADAVLRRELDPNVWVPLNDGKVSTFEAAVANRFPPLAVVMASAFAAQNRAGSFLTMDKTERKDLFAELLGLAHYEAMAEQCRAEVKTRERRRNELQALLFRLAADTLPEEEAQLEGEVRAVGAELSRARYLKLTLAALTPDLTAAVEAAYLARTQAHDAVSAREALVMQYGRIAADAERAEGARDRVQFDLNETLARIESRRDTDTHLKHAALDAVPTDEAVRAGTELRVAMLTDRCDQAVATLEAHIERDMDVLDDADDIRAAVAAVETADRALEALRETLAAHAGVVQEYAAAHDAAALIDAVPCGGQPPYDGCQLLAAAHASRARLSSLDAQVQVVRATEARIALLDAERTAQLPLAKCAAELEAASFHVGDLRVQILQRRAHLADDVAAVRAGVDEALAEVAARRVALMDELVAIQTRAKDDEAHARASAAQQLATHTTTLATLTDTLTSMNASLDASGDVQAAYTAARAADAAARAALDEHRAATARTAEDLVRLGFKEQHVEALRARYAEQVQEQAQYRAELAPLERDLVEFELLAKCFGREGLPVLEIDAAGPAVSVLCNDLLASCFGSARFQVELVTQQLKADKKGTKEVFELRVFDSERGGEARDLTDLSGGEQVIVDESLKSAIALFVREQHASPIETCWRDETTGALDPENAVRYIDMLRRLQQRGGYHHILFIAQNPDVAALADAQVHVDKATGQVTVRHAPFTEAAE